MREYNVVDNTELVELIEQGLRKGYWDKGLIPELKKRFKDLDKEKTKEDVIAIKNLRLEILERENQKLEKLLNKIKEIIDRQDDSYISSMLEESQRYYEIKKLMIKEKEND